ncbi:MAG: cyclase family protein [Desulfobacteraceae bacterium]|nr:cyclase family protein [Desulfobacteraceae bacterium]
MTEEKNIAEILKDYPKNWGKWGPNDELGTINYLTPAQVLRGIKAVKQGTLFPIGNVRRGGEADPVWPGRHGIDHFMTQDYGSYLSGVKKPFGGGLMYADCFINTYTHGASHIDAPGHVWYGDKIYNGYPAKINIGKMQKAGILPIAEHGIAGRGVLLDVARFKGVDFLAPGTQITLQDLLDTAKKQGVEIEKRDILVIRTGWLRTFYTKGREWFYKNFNEPGITAERALVDWWHKMEIPLWVTDTIACEQTKSSATGTLIPLHAAFLRDLGCTMNEVNDLEALAANCAKDGQYTFLYVASPLKIAGASGSPVNPIIIK